MPGMLKDLPAEGFAIISKIHIHLFIHIQSAKFAAWEAFRQMQELAFRRAVAPGALVAGGPQQGGHLRGHTFVMLIGSQGPVRKE